MLGEYAEILRLPHNDKLPFPSARGPVSQTAPALVQDATTHSPRHQGVHLLPTLGAA